MSLLATYATDPTTAALETVPSTVELVHMVAPLVALSAYTENTSGDVLGASVTPTYTTPLDTVGAVGRGGRRPDPGDAVEAATLAAEAELFAAAEARLGRAATRESRRGRPEREAIAAAEDADPLVVARDGDHSRLGPHSLGRATRFVVDHAPCRVLIIWPDEPPGVDTIPAPPTHPGRQGPPKHHDRPRPE